MRLMHVRFGLFERMELALEVGEEFDFARTARAVGIDQRDRGGDDGDDFLFRAVLEPVGSPVRIAR